MRLYSFFIPVICIMVFLSSCYKEKDVITNREKIPYELTEGNDVIDKYIFDFYESNGSIIKYNIDTVEYRWNMNSVARNVIIDTVKIKDALVKTTEEIDLLNNGIVMLEKVFLNVYDEDFKRKYFPLKIIMVDAIKKMVWGAPKEQNFLIGLSYIAIGGVRNGVGNFSDEKLLSLKKEINGEFWNDYLVKGGHIFIPEKFYEVSKAYYGKNLVLLPENKDDVDIDVKVYGFWNKNFEKRWMIEAPNKENDLKDFISNIITTPYSVLKSDLDKYPRLKNKYDILINRLKDKYAIDLQAIGDKNK